MNTNPTTGTTTHAQAEELLFRITQQKTIIDLDDKGASKREWLAKIRR